MTREAEIAKDVSYQLEAKKDGLKQVQSGDVKLTLTIQAADMPSELYGDVMGQRYVVVMVPVNDDETPRVEPEKPKSYAQQAVMMAKDDNFRVWCGQAGHADKYYHILDHEEASAQIIKDLCGVTTRADLIEGTEAGHKFKELQRDYNFWKNN